MKSKEIGSRGIEVWLEAGSDGKYYVTEEYRTYTCGLATIIDRMVVVGISSRQSKVHFPLNDKIRDCERRTEKGEKQENKRVTVSLRRRGRKLRRTISTKQT